MEAMTTAFPDWVQLLPALKHLKFEREAEKNIGKLTAKIHGHHFCVVPEIGDDGSKLADVRLAIGSKEFG
jgi:hypothetical protein